MVPARSLANVQEVRFVHGTEEHVEYKVKPNFRRLGPRVGKKMPAVKKAMEIADGSRLRASLLATGKALAKVLER